MATPPEPSVRDATRDDLVSITRLYAHHVLHGTASFETTPPSLAEMTERWTLVTGKGLPYLVAEAPRGLLGYAYAGPYHTRPAYRWTVEDSIYIAPDALRLGVGRALLEQLITTCTALGYRQLVAVIGDSRNTASIGLHGACGFTRAGLLQAVGFKFGGWLDSVLMQRALGSGDATPPAASP
jgi:phosphinothricin acetyltransferase